MSENVGALNSRNPKGLPGLYRDNFTFTYLEDNRQVPTAFITSDFKISRLNPMLN
jgi:hypothetical protein